MAVATSTALIAGGLLGAGGSIAGAAIGGGAQREATNQALSAQERAIQAQREQAARAEAFLREQSAIARQDLEPFRQAQLSATQQLQGLTDPNNPLFTQQRDIATQAIQRQLAAQGLLRSGRQTTQLTNLELGLAQQRAGILQGLSGLGAAQQQSALSQNLGAGLAGVAGGLGQQLGQSFQNMGQIQAQGTLAGAQAFTQGLAGINNAIQGALGGFVQQNNLEGQQDFLKGLFDKTSDNSPSPSGSVDFGVNFGDSLRQQFSPPNLFAAPPSLFAANSGPVSQPAWNTFQKGYNNNSGLNWLQKLLNSSGTKKA